MSYAALLVMAVLSGPLPYPEAEQYNRDVFVVVDTRSRKSDVALASRVVSSELKQERHGERQFFIRTYFNIKVVEWEDLEFREVPSLPCYKFGKNGTYESFLPHTFQASGTFTLSLYTILRWEHWKEAANEWLDGPKTIFTQYGSYRSYENVADIRWRLTWYTDKKMTIFPPRPLPPDPEEAFPQDFDWEKVYVETQIVPANNED